MPPSSATAVEFDPDFTPRTTITLLDLVSELSATGATDREVVAAVMDLLETGRVRLSGQICDEHRLAH
jgi:hypothetical protein